MKMKKAQILMNKTVYSGLSILDLSKTVIHEFWYDYLKPKLAKTCYMNIKSVIAHLKIDDIYKDIEEKVEKLFDAFNFEIDGPLPIRKYKKVIELMKDELDVLITKKFIVLRT